MVTCKGYDVISPGILRPRQNVATQLATLQNHIFIERILVTCFIQNTRKSVPTILIDHTPALVLMMAWCRIGEKPLSGLRIAQLIDINRCSSVSMI